LSTAQDVIDQARFALHDTDPATYRWSDVELLDYLSAAQRKIVSLIPESNVVEEVVTTTAGKARQTLPTNGIKFFKCSTNYADNGVTAQAQLRYVEKDALDTWDPDWEVSSSAPSANFHKHFCHDKREPSVYYLYPVANTATKVGVIFSKIPTSVSDITDELSLDDEYFDAMVAYVLFRAYAKEGRYTLPSNEKQMYWNQFLQMLGMQSAAEEQVGPAETAHRAPEGD